MKAILHKIASVCMALMVLFSTTSFTVDMHYCGEHLVDFGVFEEVDSCGMETLMAETSGTCEVMAMDCCSDVEIGKMGQDDLQSSFDQLTFDQQIFVTAFVYSYINLFEGLQEHIIPFKEYSPPFLIRDTQILDQTFLI